MKPISWASILYLLATGIGALFGLQSLVIMLGTLKIIPLTGVTLPLVSYGGSSLLTSMIMLGLLLHISGHVGGSGKRSVVGNGS